MEKDLDIAVVVPSHAEDDKIYFTLTSILGTVATIEEDVKVGVFVVINNAESATEETVTSNEGTAKVVQKFGEGGYHKNFGISDANTVRFETVDLYTPGQAPEICNVGVACRAGFEYANQFLKDEGYFVRTDADTRFDTEYFQQVTDKVRYAEPECRTVLTGSVDVDYSYEPGSFSSDRIYRILGEYDSLCESVLARHTIPEMDPYLLHRREFHLPGANMAIPKEAYNATAGFFPLRGAEDIMLSLEMIKHGFEIEYSNKCNVRTSGRLSERTQEGFGLGFHVKKIRSFEGDIERLTTDQIEFFLIRARLDEIADRVREHPEAFEPLVSALFRSFGMKVDTEKIQYWKAQWYEYCQTTKYLRFTEHPMIFLELNGYIRSTYPEVNLVTYVKDSLTPQILEKVPEPLADQFRSFHMRFPKQSRITMRQLFRLAMLAIADRKAQEVALLCEEGDKVIRNWERYKLELTEKLYWICEAEELGETRKKDDRYQDLISQGNTFLHQDSLEKRRAFMQSLPLQPMVKNPLLQERVRDFSEYVGLFEARLYSYFHDGIVAIKSTDYERNEHSSLSAALDSLTSKDQIVDLDDL